MTTARTLPGGPSACPQCGTEVDLTGAAGAAVTCPVCQALVPVDGPPPVACDDVEVTEVLRDYRSRGFDVEMTAAAGDRVVCGSCGVQMAAEDIQVDDVRRARDSGQDDVTVAGVALVCPNCGAKGWLMLDYGSDGDSDHTSLLEQFEYGHVQS